MSAPRDVAVLELKVRFPHDPYPQQLTYMRDVLAALKSRAFAAFEAPTGFGKILCLASVIIAYQRALSAIADALNASYADEQGGLHFAGPLTECFEDERQMCDFIASCADFADCNVRDGCLDVPSGFTLTIPRLVYTSRTHQQLEQVQAAIQSLNVPCTLAYLGARDRLCLNKEACAPGMNCAMRCKYLCRRGACQYNNPVQIQSYVPQFQTYQSVNGLDFGFDGFVSYCRQRRICPYYMTLAYSRVARVVLAPYNYVFSATSAVDGMVFSDAASAPAITVVDEAHNLASVCREQLERSFTFLDMQELIGGFLYFQEAAAGQADIDVKQDDFEQLLAFLQHFHHNMLQIAEKARFGPAYRQEEYFSYQAKELFCGALLPEQAFESARRAAQEAEYQFLTSPQLRAQMKVIPAVELLIDLLVIKQTVSAFPEHFLVLLTRAESPAPAQLNQSYRLACTPAVQRRQAEAFAGASKYADFKFQVLCLNPEPLMSRLCGQGLGQRQKEQNARNHPDSAIRQLLLTSGTLSLPAAQEAQESKRGSGDGGYQENKYGQSSPSALVSLKTEFGVAFQAAHSYPPVASIAPCYIVRQYRGVRCLGTFENKKNLEYFKALRGLVRDVFGAVQSGGILVFFPSYQFLQSFRSEFDLQDLKGTKDLQGADPPAVYFEQKQHAQTLAQIAQFKTAARAGPALLFAVMKGRVSEGADFTDDSCRVVIIVSIPFAPARDPAVIERNKRNQRQYETDALRAVAQAAGRAVRHSKDFAAVLLVDQRFQGFQAHLPGWAQTAQVCDFADVSFDALNAKIAAFHAQMCENDGSSKEASDARQKSRQSGAAQSNLSKTVRKTFSAADKAAQRLRARRKLVKQLSAEQNAAFRLISAAWGFACDEASEYQFSAVWQRDHTVFTTQQAENVLQLLGTRAAAVAGVSVKE